MSLKMLTALVCPTGKSPTQLSTDCQTPSIESASGASIDADTTCSSESLAGDSEEADSEEDAEGQIFRGLPDTNDTNDTMNDMDNYDFSETGSVCSATTVEGANLEDDDDYGAIDNLTVASDDSRQFEAEVEDDLQAEGEDNIDWDDHETYHYDEAWATGEYDIPVGQDLSMTDPMTDHALSHVIASHERMIQSAPELFSMTLAGAAGGQYPFSWADRNSSASVSSSCDTPDASPQRDLGPQQSHDPWDNDADETDDDEDVPPAIINPPTASHQSEAARTDAVPEPMPCPPESLPPTQQIKIDPRKAVAFTVKTAFGTYIRFIPPKGRALRWIVTNSPRKAASVADAGRDDESSSNSGPSSPTMIDMEDAMCNGNTRTGAVITDHVNGAVFMAHNCPPGSAFGQEPAPISSFYQKFMDTPMTYWASTTDDALLFEDELIDFEQCDEPSTTTTPVTTTASSGLQTPSEDGANDVSVPTIAEPILFGDVVTNVVPEPTLSPITPSHLSFGGLDIHDSSSPRKRRLDRRISHDSNHDSSPVVKKVRGTAADANNLA